MQRLTARDLQHRYRAGERNFAEVDLSGESLRGMNLKGIDLSGADLSHTDIRGTNFTQANLISTQFFASKAGAQFCWLGLHLLSITTQAAIIAYFTGYIYALTVAVTWANISLHLANRTSNITISSITNVLSNIRILATSFSPEFLSTVFIALAIILGLVLTLKANKIYEGNTSGLFWMSLGTIAVLCACTWAAIYLPINSVVDFTIIFFLGLTLAFVIGLLLVSFALSFLRFTANGFLEGPRIIAKIVILSLSLAGAMASIIVSFIIIAAVVLGAHLGSNSIVNGDFDISNAHVVNLRIAATGTVILCLASSVACFPVAKRTILNNLIDDSIGLFAAWVNSLGGTKFIEANLTNASLEGAILQSTDFSRANLTRTRFHLAKKVYLSRLRKTNLADFEIRNLLVTLRGNGHLCVGLHLKGAHLDGADLADANFTEADLSQATLEGATLERANLTKTQALGTNFHQAILTGATLEAWNIDSTTNLEGAICEYVYLLRNQQERRPSSGTFAPGEFSKLFQEVLDTIDLIFQNGIDWNVFRQTIEKVQVQYGNADLAVQSIENKGDGVVVVKLYAAPGSDKPAIHQSITEAYRLGFAEAGIHYKAQLDAKDDQIADYRQQSANMQEVVKLLAQRPINVDVKATAESKAMQGNDNSRTVSIGGNATGNVFQSGDGNTADLKFQQVTLPPPDRVNIQAELAALQAILAGLNDPVTTGIAAKLDTEAAKPAPDKSVIATTLETGLTYARNLQGFAEAIDKLRPHVQNAAGWLGEHGTKLLPLVGLVL